ncbi:2-hydroxyacid dehydrogenase [Metabacillus indicus]|uniref:2-hydroxyacid dehydrogenase n=1 Tax=Metabacillus indicus TaxID=246786 RepID=UPI000493A449|nr:D-glycerate dehydrogenase [Metabacillus indicus]KEZ48481.1 2-ketogluconate reductase [Metabacillus indicus LMG 22858]
MEMPSVFVARKLPEEVLKALRTSADVEMWDKEDEVCPRDLLLEKAKTSDALLTMLSDQVDKELLDACEGVKVIANLAVGYDNVDVEYAKEKGIIITNTPDVLTETTADLTFLLLMSAARRVTEAANYIKEGKWTSWSPMLLAGADVHHKTIGIVGMGNIGRAVAKRAKGFDMNILYHNRSRDTEAEESLGAEYRSFEDLLQTSDFVVCMTPLTIETKGMFDAGAFQKMKQEAIFVNTSRGGTVVEEDLIAALRNGVIAGAGLDVFENEPIRADHPILQLENAVALPHIGSATRETRFAMMACCIENIKQVLEGKKPLTPVR